MKTLQRGSRYTTGNYEHRSKTSADTANEFGQYTTVWHKNNNGEWKYLIDIGNDHPAASIDKNSKTITIKKYAPDNTTNDDALPDIENKFILSFEKNTPAAYKKFGSTQYLLNFTGYMPVTSADSAIALINKIPAFIRYHRAGIKISPGKDMAAVYGTFDYGDKKDNYLRIWRHEKNGWKIALEVIVI